MFGRWIVEFLHKRTRQICSLLAFGELTSSGFFHWEIIGKSTQILIDLLKK
jgi:hypothetical protein